MSLPELRKVGKSLGLELPKFGDMRSMVWEVLRVQDNPKSVKIQKSTSSKKSMVGYSAKELERMNLKQLRDAAKSIGIYVPPRIGSSASVIREILRAQDKGLRPSSGDKKGKKKPNSNPRADLKGNSSQESLLKLEMEKNRADLERMSRAQLIHFGVKLGISKDYLTFAATNTRLISDILLFQRDPKGFQAQMERRHKNQKKSEKKNDKTKKSTLSHLPWGGGRVWGVEQDRQQAKSISQAKVITCRSVPSLHNITAAMSRGTTVEVKIDVKEIAKALERVPLLSKLKKDILGLLANSSSAKRTVAGEPVFLEGEEGDGFYLIKSGKADVIVGKDTKVGQLSAGDYFGEGALINKAPRGATVKATEDMICLFWTKAKFMEMFTTIYGTRNLHTVFVKRHNVIASEDQKAEQTRPVESKYYNKTKDEAAEIRNWLKKSALLSHITDDNHFNAILRGFFKKTVEPGHKLCVEKEPGLFLYVIQHGAFEAISKDQGARSLHRGDLIGDVALLHDSPNTEAITARTRSDIWCISRFTFRRLLKEVSEGEMARRCAFLAQTDLCRALSSFERHNIAEALEEVKYDSGDVIVKQGDVGDCMYFLKSGDVTAYVNCQEIQWKNKELFGELALISDGAKRAATVRAVEPTVLLRLSKLAVETLLGPVKIFLEQRAKEYNRHTIVFPWGGTFGMRVFGTKVTKVEKGLQAERLGVQVGWCVVEVNGKKVDNFQDFQMAIDTNSENSLVFSGLGKKVSKKEKKKRHFPYKLPQLQKLCILGKGSFGSVYLVKAPNNETYALKCVSKKIVLDTKQSKHIVSEKEVMEKMDHPFIIKLKSTYKDSKCVFFVLELCLGGELFGLIQNKGGALSERATRFYAASVVSIFAYMHKLDIIYRDLKPENLLVDAQGFLKLVDFGFAKQITGSTFTLCGTPDYLAPEIIRGTGHGKGVDWWCLGVFIYELVASYAPFYSDTPKQTYKMICSRAPITFPPSFSRHLRHLLAGLLKRKPADRLGVIRGGADRIKSMEWFNGFDFEALEAKRVKPPYIIPVRSRLDASNFDDYSDDEEPYDCGSKPTGGWEHHFG